MENNDIKTNETNDNDICAITPMDGGGELSRYRMFGGIALNFFRAGSGERLRMTQDCTFIAVYCQSGLLSLSMPDDRTVTLAPGHYIAAGGKGAPQSACFPGGRGDAGALIFTMDEAGEEVRELMRLTGINVGGLLRMNEKGETFISRPDDDAGRVFARLFSQELRQETGLMRIKTLELLNLLSRREHRDESGRSGVDPHVAIAVRSIREKLLLNSSEKIAIEDIVPDAGLTVAQFYSAFVKMYGEKPYTYVRRYKMETAARRLEETNDKIADIGVSVGYTSASKFSEAFRSVYGVLPREYRKQKRAL